MIPTSMMADDTITPTLLKSQQAFLARLKRAGDQRVGGHPWSVHTGKPSATLLPDEPAAIWLHLASLAPDPDAPFQASGFFGMWEISVIIRDPGADQYGFDEKSGMEILGGILRVLEETLDDASLDGAVDDVQHLGSESAIGVPAGGDRMVMEMLVRIRAWHPFMEHDRT